MDPIVTGPVNPNHATDPTMVPVQESTQTQSFIDSDLPQRGIRPNSKWEMWWDNVVQNAEEETTSAITAKILRWNREREFKGTKLSPEEANKLYPGMPEPFSEPVDPVLAQFAYNEFKRRESNQAWKERGPETGLLFEFSSAIPGALLDPANAALNLATAGAFAAAKIEMKAGAILAENVVQNIATEMLVRSRRADEQQPLTAGESAMNVGVGSLVGTGLHLAGKALAAESKQALAKVQEHIKKTPPGTVRKNLMRLIKTHEGGQKLNPTAASMEGRPGFVENSPNMVDPGAKFAQIAHPSERQFYMAEHGEAGTPVLASDDFGGTVVVDNPTHARNLTAGEDPGSHGTVRTVDISPDAKFVDLDTTDPIASKVAKELGIEIKDGATLREVLNEAKRADPGNIVKAREIFAREGYGGLTEVIDTPSGKANATHLFDQSKAEVSESIPVDEAKLATRNDAEIERLQAETDAPENRRFYEPENKRPDAFVDPEGKAVEPFELEAGFAKSELDSLASEYPEIKAELERIDALEKYDQNLPQVFNEVLNSISLSDSEAPAKIRAELLKKGIASTEQDLDALTNEIDAMRLSSRDEVEFHQKASQFLKDDVIDWAAKRKAERMMNAKIVYRFLKAAHQTENGRDNVLKNFLDLLRGGGLKRGNGVNLSTHDMAGSLETGWLLRMNQTLGKNLQAAESGLLEKEITHEMANLEQGGSSMVSGNKQAFEIAKVYHDIKEELFAVKAGYSPFLEKTSNYFYRQTHDRELVQQAGRDQWIQDAFLAFGERSFPNRSAEDVVKKLGEIFDSIVEGRYHSSIFDKEAGDYNLAFRLANKRTLEPTNWQAFYEYNTKYGKGNVHVTMADMIRSASRDIAVMSKFGTTPRANVQKTISRFTKLSPELAQAFSKAEDDILDAMHVQTFAYNRPAEALRARIVTGAQKWTTLASNGMTFLRSTMDFASAATAVTDLSGKTYLGNFSEIFWKYAKNFAKGSKEANEFATEFGAFVESANRNLYLEIGSASQEDRLDKLLQLHSKFSLADRHRAAMTASMAEVVALRLAKYADSKWSEIPEFARQALARYGIDEKSHKLLKHGVEEINGRKYLTPEKLRSQLIKLMRGGELSADVEDGLVLERVPKVVERPSDSAYNRPGSPYEGVKDRVLAPRKDGEFGADLSPLPAYNAESSAKLAQKVHEDFVKAGFNDIEAGVAATLHGTFFDTVAKVAGKDPYEMFSAYSLRVMRERQTDGVSGYLLPYSKARGYSILSTKLGKPMDKTVIHESAHFFLETLADVRRLENLDGNFKGEIEGLYKWLGAKDGEITGAAHERFANSFEAYLRTNKAPTTGLEKLFATIRDWYRRAFESIRRGFAGTPFSLAKAERAPQHIEDFYKKLMGGSGPSELHGDLHYAPETMSPNELYGNLGAGTTIRLPNDLTDLIMKTGAIINDQVAMATTSPGAKERSIMYGRQDINTWRGALWRAFWQFKSSSVKAFDTVARSYYSGNPGAMGERLGLQGDLTKVMKFVTLSMGLYTLQDQAENLMSGKTPEDPATPEYALKAMMASGAGTVMGDTLVSELLENNTARGMAWGLFRSAIPAVTRAVDVTAAGLATAKAPFSEDTKFPGGDVGRALVSNIPYQNIFYAKALLHYYFLNGIREEFGPGFLGSLERAVSRKPGLLEDQQQYFMLRPTESEQWIKELYQ